MEFYKQYPSGLRLVAKYLDNFYTVATGVYVNVGSIRETAETNGLSHFIEHLVFKGTERRTSLQISEEMDDIGANLNAFTSKDSTCFYTKSISTDLEKCVDLLSDMYFNAAIPPEELEKERGVVLEEINMSADTPEDVSADLIGEALYFNQPLGQTILGNPENIKYYDRDSILNYKRNHYFPAKRSFPWQESSISTNSTNLSSNISTPTSRAQGSANPNPHASTRRSFYTNLRTSTNPTSSLLGADVRTTATTSMRST